MIISKETIKQIDSIDFNNNQPLLLTGEKELYNLDILNDLTAKFLDINKDELLNYPFLLRIKTKTNSLKIEEIRNLLLELSLAVLIEKNINRVVVIEEADKLTLASQNALLKVLEEPPVKTVIILSTDQKNTILPTIISRVRTINIKKPILEEAINYYESKYSEEIVKKNYLLVDGKVELLDKILNQTDKQIEVSLITAKNIISDSKLSNISKIANLSKNKEDLNKVIDIIKQMAIIGSSSSNVKQALKWQKILSSTLNLKEQLKTNTQTKLSLLNYFLSI